MYSRHRVRVMRYAIVIERAEGNFSAYVPDLPVALRRAGRARSARRWNGRFGKQSPSILMIDGLREDGTSVPEPRAMLAYVDTDPAAKTQVGAPSA